MFSKKGEKDYFGDTLWFLVDVGGDRTKAVYAEAIDKGKGKDDRKALLAIAINLPAHEDHITTVCADVFDASRPEEADFLSLSGCQIHSRRGRTPFRRDARQRKLGPTFVGELRQDSSQRGIHEREKWRILAPIR